MKERPILFSGSMVRKLLSNAKHQTRRLVNPQPLPPLVGWAPNGPGLWKGVGKTADVERQFISTWPMSVRCPYGQAGERLIVKENAWIWCRKEQDGETKTGRPKFNYIPMGRFVHYQADEQKPTYRVNESPDQGWRLKIGRYLPRLASRITLEVTSVRVERLNDISEEDAKAEGAERAVASITPENEVRVIQIDGAGTYREGFAALWCQLNGVESWDANPWVWVVEFKRVEDQP